MNGISFTVRLLFEDRLLSVYCFKNFYCLFTVQNYFTVRLLPCQEKDAKNETENQLQSHSHEDRRTVPLSFFSVFQ